jgi:hypothetical protein
VVDLSEGWLDLKGVLFIIYAKLDEGLFLLDPAMVLCFLVAQRNGCCLTHSMSAAEKLRTSDIFEVVPENEIKEVYEQIAARSLAMVGRCSDGAILVFKVTERCENYSCFRGMYRTNSSNRSELEGTFSFTLNDNKYLFRATLNAQDHRHGELNLNTMLYRIQRRSVKRLKIPDEYYAVVKLTHHNVRMLRIFGKLKDISPRGLGIVLPKEAIKLKVDDVVKVVLTISQRPPETIDLKVVHSRELDKQDEKNREFDEGVFFGAKVLPENSIGAFKRMNAIVNDIYRDLFGSIIVPKN